MRAHTLCLVDGQLEQLMLTKARPGVLCETDLPCGLLVSTLVGSPAARWVDPGAGWHHPARQAVPSDTAATRTLADIACSMLPAQLPPALLMHPDKHTHHPSQSAPDT